MRVSVPEHVLRDMVAREVRASNKDDDAHDKAGWSVTGTLRYEDGRYMIRASGQDVVVFRPEAAVSVGQVTILRARGGQQQWPLIVLSS